MAAKKKGAKKVAKKAPPRAHAKAGQSKEAAEDRKILFALAYLENGRNKTQAAITAGYTPGRAAEKAGQRLSQNVAVQKFIAQATQRAAQTAGLSVERTLREIARIAYADPRVFYKDGKLVSIDALSDDAAAVIASVEQREEFVEYDEGKKAGEGVTVSGYLKKIKLWNKNTALEQAMKYHGLYREEDKQPTTIVVNSVNYATLHKPKAHS